MTTARSDPPHRAGSPPTQSAAPPASCADFTTVRPAPPSEHPPPPERPWVLYAIAPVVLLAILTLRLLDAAHDPVGAAIERVRTASTSTSPRAPGGSAPR